MLLKFVGLLCVGVSVSRHQSKFAKGFEIFAETICHGRRNVIPQTHVASGLCNKLGYHKPNPVARSPHSSILPPPFRPFLPKTLRWLSENQNKDFHE
jgi:hypothetical protein